MRTERRARTAILDALTRRPDLYATYVLKGGLALHLAFGSPRESFDIDLNAVDDVEPDITDETSERLLRFHRHLDDALASVRSEYAFDLLSMNGQRLSEELPTLLTEVRFRSDDGEEGAVKLQVTLSDRVCQTVRRTVRGLPLRLAAPEDILADKLKALLQQVPRDKVRSSDVFDVWYFAGVSPLPIDRRLVADFLKRKCRSSDVMPPLAKDQFRRKSVIAYSAADYDTIAPKLPASIEPPPFRELYAGVLAFVDSLDLPEKR